MSRLLIKSFKSMNNLLKIKSRVLFHTKSCIAIAHLPYLYNVRQFCVEKKNVGKNYKPSISSLITTELTKNKEETDAREEKEESWRTMKYTLTFLGISFVAIGSYIVLEFGKPAVASDGSELKDEYSTMPTWMQYVFRTLREVDYYKRLIKEPSRDKLLPDELPFPYFQPKYTLVIELTDVLVHPDWTYHTGWRFKKRPGVDYFLDTLSGTYEIVIYTAEQGMTVFPIIEALDPKNLITYKLVRDATHFVDGHHIKNLNKLNRDLKKIIVVDWNHESVKFHMENMFWIPRWSGNDEDTTLLDLTAFLMTVANSNVEDVRDVLNYYSQFENGLAAFREKQKIVYRDEKPSRDNKAQASLTARNWTQILLNKPVL